MKKSNNTNGAKAEQKQKQKQKQKTVLKHERCIYERESSIKGPYLQVKVSSTINGITKFREVGRFFYSDYPSNKICMQQAIKCRNDFEETIKTNNIEVIDCTVDECYQTSLELLVDSIKTAKKHNAIYNAMMPDRLKIKNILEVTTEDVNRTLVKYASDHAADAVKRAKSIWHQIFLAAAIKDINVTDKSLLVKLPKTKVPTKKRDVRCTFEEIKTFLNALLICGSSSKSGRHRAADLWYGIQIEVYTGMRPQEVFALHRSDVDLESMEINVSRSVGSTSKDTRKFITTKTEDSVRTIPIASDLVPILEDLLEKKPQNQEPLFLDLDGLPYEIDVLCTFMNKIPKKYDVPRITLYMPRHLFATELYNDSRNNKKAVQKLMGHKSETTTLGYVTASEEEAKQVIEKRKHIVS